ncbi:MAG: hypothetical protein ACE5SW_09635 [Nitrososphaeraceae archaeon]
MSLRNTSKALEPFKDQKRNYVALWEWIQRSGSLQIFRRKRVTAFIIDETALLNTCILSCYLLPN